MNKRSIRKANEKARRKRVNDELGRIALARAKGAHRVEGTTGRHVHQVCASVDEVSAYAKANNLKVLGWKVATAYARHIVKRRNGTDLQVHVPVSVLRAKFIRAAA